MTAKHKAEHLVPIVTHGASRRQHKRRRYRLVWTPFNFGIAIIAGSMIFWVAYKFVMTVFINLLCMLPTVY